MGEQVLYWIGTTKSEDYVVNNESHIDHKTYPTYEAAEAALPAAAEALIKDNIREAEGNGEKYDPQDPEQWHPEDLRIRKVTIDNSDWAQ